MLDYKAEVFIRVARSKTISQAARELNLSQPAVTTAIQKLEDQFGVKLFYRRSRGLELTTAGSRLYQHLWELKNRSIEAENEMMKIKGTVHGHLRLGASPTFGEYILPGLLGEFSRQHPQIGFSLVIGNNQQIYDRLKEGQVELAFLAGKLPGKRLAVFKILEDELVLIVSPRHPWSEVKILKKEELPAQPLIIREQGSSSRKETEEAIREMGFALDKLTVIAEFYSLEAIKGAVESGMGVALISRWAITKELKLKTLIPVKIRGISLRRDIFAAYLQESTLTEAASRLLQLASNLDQELDL